MNVQGISPMITAPLQARTAQSAASTSGASSSSSSSGTGGLSATDLEGTFLNLLATELQNQDPTSPVDPTEMVGQLVSLNQLDQLISINQTLSNLGSSSTGSTTSNISAENAVSSPITNYGGISETRSSGPTSQISPPLTQIPSEYAATAGSNALMNLYGNFTVPTQNHKTTSTGGR
ncbi:MAG: flagellar hook capping FlgD N-terminal domain-containing protein [Terracidiphilus sp.]|jgi:flagellar basal-body rod modification protein FlgD